MGIACGQLEAPGGLPVERLGLPLRGLWSLPCPMAPGGLWPPSLARCVSGRETGGTWGAGSPALGVRLGLRLGPSLPVLPLLLLGVGVSWPHMASVPLGRFFPLLRGGVGGRWAGHPRPAILALHVLAMPPRVGTLPGELGVLGLGQTLTRRPSLALAARWLHDGTRASRAFPTWLCSCSSVREGIATPLLPQRPLLGSRGSPLSLQERPL